MASVAGNSEALPIKAKLWFSAKVLLALIGAVIAGQGVRTYDRLDSFLTQANYPDLLTASLDDDKKLVMAWFGGFLILLSTVAALFQERAALKDSIRVERDSLFFLDNLRERAGPQIRYIMNATDSGSRDEALKDFRGLILQATDRRWPKKSIRAGYYKCEKHSNAYRLELLCSYPSDADLAEKIASYPSPLRYKARNLLWWQRGRGELSFLAKSQIHIPVSSPLETNPQPIALVIADSPKRRTFAGRADEVTASFIAGWLGVGELAANSERPTA
jgi:hypothetical protein